eukprot:scaffold35808_cov79-Attheya_sp.AAC.1
MGNRLSEIAGNRIGSGRYAHPLPSRSSVPYLTQSDRLGPVTLHTCTLFYWTPGSWYVGYVPTLTN